MDGLDEDDSEMSDDSESELDSETEEPAGDGEPEEPLGPDDDIDDSDGEIFETGNGTDWLITSWIYSNTNIVFQITWSSVNSIKFKEFEINGDSA